MEDARVETESAQHADAADTEHDLLAQTPVGLGQDLPNGDLKNKIVNDAAAPTIPPLANQRAGRARMSQPMPVPASTQATAAGMIR